MSQLLDVMQAHARLIMETVPFARALGMEAMRVEKGYASARLSWRADLVGDLRSGVLHGGVVTALLDSLSGVAVASALESLTSIATLDLRIDYMRGSEPGRDLHAEARVIRLTRRIAFVQALAFHENAADPVATASAAFMLGSNGGRKAGHNLSSMVPAPLSEFSPQ